MSFESLWYILDISYLFGYVVFRYLSPIHGSSFQTLNRIFCRANFVRSHVFSFYGKKILFSFGFSASLRTFCVALPAEDVPVLCVYSHVWSTIVSKQKDVIKRDVGSNRIKHIDLEELKGRLRQDFWPSREPRLDLKPREHDRESLPVMSP